MSNRTLGILGLIGAPFLLIDTLNNGLNPFQTTSISGFLNFLYTTGWMCSMVALYRIGALGEGRFATILFAMQMSFLALAECWNIYEWIQPQAGAKLYLFLDAFWPISNLCMLLTGGTIAIKGVLKGWRRFVPLMAGLWLPLGLILWIFFSRTPGMLLTVGIYSIFAWSLLALSIITLPNKKSDDNQDFIVSGRRKIVTAG